MNSEEVEVHSSPSPARDSEMSTVQEEAEKAKAGGCHSCLGVAEGGWSCHR